MNKVRVIVPTPLRKHTSGASEIEATGQTLGEVLDNLEAQHPGVIERVLDQGEVRHFLKIFIAGEDSRYTGGLSSTVSNGDTIYMSMALAGG